MKPTLKKTIWLFSIFLVFLCVETVCAQNVTVSPTSATVYSQGATSVFLTFSNAANLRPVSGTFCGDIIPATPDLGFRCDPATIFGSLPVRYDQSRTSGASNYTDVMSVPPSVARRAYQDAVQGKGTFFYVRRFVRTDGPGPDEYVVVTLRLSGNGASTSFSLTNVKLLWDGGRKTVPFVKSDEPLPSITAEITYTGTGRLVGRWEIVKPGDTPPSPADLLPEASLPPEARGRQRRFTQLSRFNVQLPPGGRYELPGPENWRVDKTLAGGYQLLLRIEAVPDPANPTNAVPAGATAGFSLPTLKYFVSVGDTADPKDAAPTGGFAQEWTLLPENAAVFPMASVIGFKWSGTDGVAYYRLEVTDGAGKAVHSAMLPAGRLDYRGPSWLGERATDGLLKWRVKAFGPGNQLLAESPEREIRITGRE